MKRHRSFVALWSVAALAAAFLAWPRQGSFVDSLAYYGGHYGLLGQQCAFLYSPAASQVLAPLRLLSPSMFVVAWTLILMASYLYVARWWFPLVILAGPVMNDLAVGNMYGLLALVCVVGFRYPAAWSVVLLTKITPGIGLLWFAVRREWRNLGIALGVTAAIAVVSFVLVPGEWFTWIRTLVAERGQADPWAGVPFGLNGYLPIPLALRLIVAAVLIILGARANLRSVMPLAVALAVPQLWMMSFATLAALPVLLVDDLRRLLDTRDLSRVPTHSPEAKGLGRI